MNQDSEVRDQRSATVEAVGWLLVDEDGHWCFYGGTDTPHHNAVNREGADSFFKDSDLPEARAAALHKLGVVTQVYELVIRVPRPARVKLSVELGLPPLPVGLADARADIAPRSTEPAAEEPVDDQVDEEAEEDEPAASTQPSEDDELLAAIRDFVGSGVKTASDLSFRFTRNSTAILALCEGHPWFTVRRKGRGHQITLTEEGSHAADG